MSFARYAEYKDSGVEWLGQVPAHWDVKRLKRISHLLTEKTDRRDGPVALENIESWSGRYVQTESDYSGEGVGFESGDILFGKLRPYLAKVLLADFAGEAVGDFHVLRPTSPVVGRFVQYQLLNATFISIVDGSTFGVRMPRASWEFMGGMPLSLPPVPEQTAIAAFLDRETGKIDALVAEQQKLIGLLKEKRQAVISHAVTKGLNPQAPMKPSGIEWLGDVPAHWKIVSAKRVASVFVPQRNKPDLNDDGVGVGWATMDDMKGAIVEVTRFSVSEESALSAGSRTLPAGAVIASCVGTFGVAAINSVPLVINQQLQAYVPTEQILAQFLRNYLISFGCYFESIGTAATLIYVNQQGFERLPIALPSLDEQLQITSMLKDSTAAIDSMIESVNLSAALLKERRSALISAAVTGQIDVRGLAVAPADDAITAHG